MKEILSNEEYCKLGTLFGLMSGETRLKIIWCLHSGEKNVGKIAEKVNMTVSAVSHQLKELKNNDILISKKEGQTIYYKLKDRHILNIMDIAAEHILHENCDDEL